MKYIEEKRRSNEPEKVFNASTCGDNCAKWLLLIAASEEEGKEKCWLQESISERQR